MVIKEISINNSAIPKTVSSKGDSSEGVALQASLEELESLLGVLLARAGVERQEGTQLEQVLDELIPVLETALIEAPEKTGQLIGRMAPLFDGIIKSGSPEEVASITQAFTRLTESLSGLGKNQALSTTFAFFAGLGVDLPGDGKEVDQLASILASFDPEMISSVTNEEAEQVAEFFGTLFEHSDPTRMKDLSKRLQGILTRLRKEDGSKYTALITGLAPVINLISVTESVDIEEAEKHLEGLTSGIFIEDEASIHVYFDGLQTALKTGNIGSKKGEELASVITRDTKMQKNVSKHTNGLFDLFADTDKDEKTTATIMAALIAAVQAVQVLIMDKYAEKDQALAELGKAQLLAAQQNLEDTIKQINEIKAKQEEAKNAGFWGTVFKVLSFVVGAVISMMTMGTMAALVSILISAFMMSPWMKDAVDGLKETFKSMGLPDCIAGIFAKAFIIVAAVIATKGATKCDASRATTAFNAKELARIEAGGIPTSATQIKTATTAASKAQRMFQFSQGVAVFAAVNPLQEIWELPGIKEVGGGVLSTVLETLTQIVCMILVIIGGCKTVSAYRVEGAAERIGTRLITGFYPKIMAASIAIQSMTSAASAGIQGWQASISFGMANVQEKRAELMARSRILETLMQILQNIKTGSQKTGQEMVAELQIIVDEIQREVSAPMDKVGQLIAR